VDSTKEFSVLSLCSGYGGLERGLDLVGVNHKVVTYVEIEAYVIANLISKMESRRLVAAPVFTDVKSFPSRLFRGKVDIITGGYPCQPFSVAGRRAGEADPRHLWPFILEHVKAIRPLRVFFENVTGHINFGLEAVLQDLEAAGYRATWGIFSAAEVGARHQRERVFIMADSKSQRVQGLWSSGQQESQAHVQSVLPVCESERPFQADWETEPRMDRVVDGCPSRVDRIRMLGNGVVPQTAARAWQVLSERLEV